MSQTTEWVHLTKSLISDEILEAAYIIHTRYEDEPHLSTINIEIYLVHDDHIKQSTIDGPVNSNKCRQKLREFAKEASHLFLQDHQNRHGHDLKCSSRSDGTRPITLCSHSFSTKYPCRTKFPSLAETLQQHPSEITRVLSLMFHLPQMRCYYDMDGDAIIINKFAGEEMAYFMFGLGSRVSVEGVTVGYHDGVLFILGDQWIFKACEAINELQKIVDPNTIIFQSCCYSTGRAISDFACPLSMYTYAVENDLPHSGQEWLERKSHAEERAKEILFQGQRACL